MNFILEFSVGLLFCLAWLNYLSLPQFLMSILSVILSAFDYRHHSFPFIIWLIFALSFIILFPSSLIFYSWLVLALLTEIFDFKIGSGDFYGFYGLIFYKFFDEMKLLQIACLLGIIYYLMIKNETKLPSSLF